MVMFTRGYLGEWTYIYQQTISVFLWKPESTYQVQRSYHKMAVLRYELKSQYVLCKKTIDKPLDWLNAFRGTLFFDNTLQNQRLWPLESSLVWMGFLRWASWIPPIYRAKPMISSSNGWFYTSFKRQTQYALFRHWISVFHDEIQKIKIW